MANRTSLAAAVIALAASLCVNAQAQSIFAVTETTQYVFQYALDGTLLHSFQAVGSGRIENIKIANGDIYLADHDHSAVHIYDMTGTHLTDITSHIATPYGLVFDKSGNMYVGNDSGKIEKYNASGTWIGTFASGLAAPFAMTFDSAGNLYVGEQTTGNVKKYNPAGTLITTIPTGEYYIQGLTISSTGSLLVSEYNNNQIHEYSLAGADLGLFASPGSGTNPTGITIDASGNVYDALYSSGVIEKYGPGGGTGTVFATPGRTIQDVTFYEPQSPATPEPGSIAIAAGLLTAASTLYRKRRK